MNSNTEEQVRTEFDHCACQCESACLRRNCVRTLDGDGECTKRFGAEQCCRDCDVVRSEAKHNRAVVITDAGTDRVLSEGRRRVISKPGDHRDIASSVGYEVSVWRASDS